MSGFMKGFAHGRLSASLAALALVCAFGSASAAPDPSARPINSVTLDFGSALTPTEYDLGHIGLNIPGRDGILARDIIGSARFGEDFSLQFGYRAGSMAGLLSESDANSGAAYRGLFADAQGVNAPYASLTDGGSFFGATIKLANDLHFSVAKSLLTPERDPFVMNPYATAARVFGDADPLTDRRSADATVASLNWDVASWAGLGVIASQTSERGGVLGEIPTESLGIEGGKTTAAGISGRVGFGDGWVTTASYSLGITQLAPKRSTFLSTNNDVHSRAYGVAVAKNGLFGHSDTLGLAVSRPIQVYGSGNSLLSTALLESKTMALSFTPQSIGQATKTPETDFELGYVTTFFDGALALQTNAAYQMNLSGQNGKNALAVVSRAKINF